MIAIAGLIGAGFFVGSGAAIRQTGLGVLLPYLAAGVLVVPLMRMLDAMSATTPETQVVLRPRRTRWSAGRGSRSSGFAGSSRPW
jgi:L-asparagine transporter-like permease